MHAEDRLRPRPDLDPGRIEVHRLWVDVDEHRLQTGERDDIRGRREGVGGHDDLVTRLQLEREHGEVQRRGARRDGDRVLDLADARDLRLELAHLRAHGEHAALQDLRDLGELGLADGGPA